MTRYPKAARSAHIKCISCNAPVTETIEGEYVCVEYSDRLITEHIQKATPSIAEDD